MKSQKTQQHWCIAVITLDMQKQDYLCKKKLIDAAPTFDDESDSTGSRWRGRRQRPVRRCLESSNNTNLVHARDSIATEPLAVEDSSSTMTDNPISGGQLNSTDAQEPMSSLNPLYITDTH